MTFDPSLGSAPNSLVAEGLENIHTAGLGLQLNHVEVAAAYWTTVRPFYPGLQAYVVQYVSTGEQLGYLARAFIVIGRRGLSRWVSSIVEIESWHRLDRERVTGAFAKVS